MTDKVTGVLIQGLTLINGRPENSGSSEEGYDTSGGCLLLGQQASILLRNSTLHNCSVPGVCSCIHIREGERDQSGIWPAVVPGLSLPLFAFRILFKSDLHLKDP